MIACDACEEWYHGDCIRISEKEAKLIKQFFCIRCRKEDSTLQTKWKAKRDEHIPKEELRLKKQKEKSNCKNDKKQKKCGDCVGCYQIEDCRRCDTCIRETKSGFNKQKAWCKQRVCINFGDAFVKNRRKLKDSSSDYEGSNTHLMTGNYGFLYFLLY